MVEVKTTSIYFFEISESGYRLEASVFNMDAKNAMEKLNHCKYPVVKLCSKNGLATVYHRPRFKRIYVEKSEFPIYQPSQITDINPHPQLFLSKLTQTDIASLIVKKNQILMTCSGTIGKCTYVSETLMGKIFSHDLLRITARNPKDSGFIYAFLRTKLAQLLISTNNYGAVIQHIEPEHLSEIPIPNPPQKIKDIVSKKIELSFQCRDESNKLINKAKDLLMDSLKLPSVDKLNLNYYKSDFSVCNFSLPLSEVSKRLDGSFHSPELNTITDFLLDNSDTILSLDDKSLTKKIFHPERFKRVYVSENQGIPFFGGKDLETIEPMGMKYISAYKHSMRIPDLILRENMILISRSGTVGKINIVPSHWDGWIATDDLLRVIPMSEKISGYLYIWLSSYYGRKFIERYIYGSVVDHIEVEHIAKMPIPLLKDEKLIEKINYIALNANKLRSDAYNFEQEAINQVNDIIFNG